MLTSKNKILITGGNGLLGQKLRHYLSQKECFFIATSKGSDAMSGHDHLYIQMDIESKNQCNNVLLKYQPNVIINAAAMTNVDKCEQYQEQCSSVNYKSLKNLISYCQTYDSHFIHISTDFVFNGKSGFYAETDSCKPINHYGLCKYKAEKLISSNLVNYTIFRTSLLFDINSNIDNFFFWMQNQFSNNRQLNIVDDQYRTPTFVYDLVEVIFKSLIEKKYGIYHVSSGERLSVYQIVCTFARLYGFNMSLINPIKSNELRQIAIRPVDSSLMIDKAIREFDFKPTRIINLIN